MFKTHEKTFNFLQKSLDATFVIICWFVAYYLRFEYMKDGQSGLFILFIKFSPLLAILSVYFFHRFDLYRSLRFNSRYREIMTVFYANSSAILAFVTILYFFAESRLSRLTLIYYFLISTFVLIFLRIMVRNYLRIIRQKGRNLRHVLLIGSGRQVAQYVSTAREFKDSGIRFLGWIDGGELPDIKNIPILEMSLKKAKTLLKPDAIVIGYSSAKSHKVEEILRDHHNDLIPLQILPDLTYSLIGHQIEDFAGIPVLTFNQPNFGAIPLFLKRAIDSFGSLCGLLVLSPLLFLLSLLVKLTSPGPIFYAQERMGLDGRPFNMWKFRTMRVAKEGDDKNTWTTENDPRKTKFGNLLRKSSLDELPQLWNVLTGDMSIVGPRPERPFFVRKFREEIPGYMLRHKMKAGITGWAQINGWRGNTSIEKRIECDNYYIKNWSLWMDIKIIFLTFWKGFINKNAY